MSVTASHEWRWPGCGDECRPRQHDPEAHERHGAAQERERARMAMHAPVVRTGPLVIDPARREVLVGGGSVTMLPTEWRILGALVARPGAMVLHEEMASAVFGDDWRRLRWRSVLNAMRMQRVRLRAKLGPAAHLLTTVRCVGVRLEMVPAEYATDPLAEAVERANAALDWIEARQGPLREDNFATIETTVGVVRALRRKGVRG